MKVARLISHRLRGFGFPENSREALRAAAAAPVPMLEIDTRVTGDGHICVAHDPWIYLTGGEKLLIAAYPKRDLADRSVAAETPLFLLEEALELFSARSKEHQVLCIDIKDHGNEVEHLQLVRRFSLEDRVVFISWIPEVLEALGGQGCRSPLFLSHHNLMRFRLPGRWFAAFSRNLAWRWGRTVVRGAGRIFGPGYSRWRGFTHAMVMCRPPENLSDLLRGSGGGICVHRAAAGADLREYCRAGNLRLWVFATRSTTDFLQLSASDGIDGIFHDDAPRLLADMGLSAGSDAVQGRDC